MTQQDIDGVPAGRQATPARRRVANLAAQLVGGAGLAFGAITTLAKRRRKDKEADGNTEDAHAGRREERQAVRQEQAESDDKADKREARQERRETRQEENGRKSDDGSDSVDKSQKASRQSNNNNNDDTDDDDDNNRGNDGSGFFDSPLASKARRRSNDFDNNRDRDDEPRDEPLAGERDEDGQQTFETNNVFFSNGPDGLEVVTGNIEYSAPPTPTPTPFPTLTLPERDRLDVFGDRVIAAPTPTPTDSGTSSGSAPPPADSGTSGSTGSRPTPTPSTGDTSGGDNTSDFLS